MHITTKNGKEYASDYSVVRTTPEIDSISWLRDNGGVRIYINTHDDQNKTKYYRWSYSETWEFHAALPELAGLGIFPVQISLAGAGTVARQQGQSLPLLEDG